MSRDEGEQWHCIARHLPEIYAVETAEPSYEPMKVLIPSPLRSYTRAREVEATGATLGELLADLDRQFPGIRFRVIDEQDRMRRISLLRQRRAGVRPRPSMRPTDEVCIVQALSGG